jgi:hypothetical protein
MQANNAENSNPENSKKNCQVQFPPLYRINLGRHKDDYNNRMNEIIDVFCVLFVFNWASNRAVARPWRERRLPTAPDLRERKKESI